MVPKLVADDIPLLRSLLSDVFPGIPYVRAEMTALRAKILEVCQEMSLVFGENDARGSLWVEKVCRHPSLCVRVCFAMGKEGCFV